MSAPPAYANYGHSSSATPSNVPFSNPQSKIELKIACRNLVDMDVFSKSDPFCVVYMGGAAKDSWREIGRTEVIWDNLNPDFVKSFIIDYFFEEQQMLKFEVYDADSDSRNLTEHALFSKLFAAKIDGIKDYIGKLVTSLGSIVGEHGGRIKHGLQDPSVKDKERNDKFTRKSPGTIIIVTEEVASNKDVVTLQFCAKKLDRMDFFGKSDPFLTFERCLEDGSFSVVHKTEVIKNTLDPNWQRFTIKSQTLCNGDPQRTILVKCWDWERDGGHRVIGQFETTQNDLAGYGGNRPSAYDLINLEKKAKKKSYKKSGTVHILMCHVVQKPSFLDFIRGGLELAFIVAIDFTASNGDPRQPQSLHYNQPDRPSHYVQALQALGSVIEDYDSDKLFPAYGFGAKLPPNWNVSHEFALNFNPANPDCYGIDGVIAAYFNSIANVQLYGPTNFSPVINSAANIARQSTREGINQYFILLIITDGIITDMERTKEAIVEAAKLPMSIIIVGVGSADFDAMEVLDGDDVRLKDSRGRIAERDIVQFVPFREFMKNNSYDPMSGVRLAKEVLHELPDQLVESMEKHGVKPNHPPPAYSS